jgi:hypothetical protein
MASDHDPSDPFDLNGGKPAPPPAADEIFGHGRVSLQTLQPDQLVRGIYRIGRCLQRVSRNNDGYRVVDLIDGASALRCYGWKADLVQAPALIDGTLVEATFLSYDYEGHVRGRLCSLKLVANPSPDDVIATLPPSLCPIAGVVDRLRLAVNAIQHGLLREFVARVFLDYALTKRYFLVPASFDDHHPAPGGMAEHSVEMALDASRSTILSELDRDLAIVHAIFHDLGKIETHERTQRSRDTHRAIDHEALTLFLALRWLDEQWPDGGRALKIGWVPARTRRDRKEQPVIYPPAELIRGLDRTSRAASMQRDHARADGSVTELSRGRVVWAPTPPPATAASEECSAKHAAGGKSASQ